MSERERLLTNWLVGKLGLEVSEIRPASSDASFRRYFRIMIVDRRYFVAMDAPPVKEDCRPFISIAEKLSALGVHVPEIHASDPLQGFLLLEDLGARLYLDALTNQTADRLYGDALGALIAMQVCEPKGLAPYDKMLLRQEMQLFPEWLIEKQLDYSLTSEEKRMLHDAFDFLIENALEQPTVFVHRDFHSRNLLETSTHNPGVIDFQDAVAGPITYDLVSLLKDCYIRWSRPQVLHWVKAYYELALQSGVLHDVDETRFLRWFDLMGVQRHLKAAGIFARLNLRDGKSDYLKDIPRTLGYIVEAAGIYPEIEALGDYIERQVLGSLSERAFPQ